MFDSMKGTVTRNDWIAVGVVLAITVAIVAGYWFGVRGKQLQQITDIDTKIATVEKDLREAQEKQKNIAKLREETDKINRLVSDFEKRLPSEREILGLVGTFEQFAFQVSLRHQLKPETPVKDERKETIPYSVTVWGDFHQIASFINRLERYERYLKVSNLLIEQQEAGLSKATFTLSTFRFLGKAATPVPQTAAAPAAGVAQ